VIPARNTTFITLDTARITVRTGGLPPGLRRGWEKDVRTVDSWVGHKTVKNKPGLHVKTGLTREYPKPGITVSFYRRPVKRVMSRLAIPSVYTRLIPSFLTKVDVSATYESVSNSETGGGRKGAVCAPCLSLPKKTRGTLRLMDINDQQHPTVKREGNPG